MIKNLLADRVKLVPASFCFPHAPGAVNYISNMAGGRHTALCLNLRRPSRHDRGQRGDCSSGNAIWRDQRV
jgi:hypothetical protein